MATSAGITTTHVDIPPSPLASVSGLVADRAADISAFCLVCGAPDTERFNYVWAYQLELSANHPDGEDEGDENSN